MKNSWDAYLIDLDGTLYHGGRIIPGAELLINTMKERGIPFLFVTNNSSRTPEDVALHLKGMGIPAEANDVCTSAVAAAEYVAELMPGCKVAPIGEYGLIEALKAAGLNVDLEAPEVVIQGIDRTFTYDKLTQATRWISGGAKYVLTNPDLLLPSQEGLMPGAGTISAAIKAATGVEPIVVGKPSEILMKHAIERLGLANEQTAVIGDNMLTDITAGVNAGCGTILTLTGVTTEENLQHYVTSSGVSPDTVCKDLIEVLDLVCKSN
ncbi:TIGR01457 family HAD-type hydrolase [Paenibacillus segetis]|uniref:Acid sugar phosphatase n=1 Tax=Paenibacillus segetis TaxID=1325360 RepID=A0ABQ1YEQ9_9BACL|nr:TIGR01457 family HAD-type hydrolase [Paenibacillus segetis]GGH22782.1 haloacid dehalogenase [Paenibacillus segetis]